jgi:hypothetical protein
MIKFIILNPLFFLQPKKLVPMMEFFFVRQRKVIREDKVPACAKPAGFG